jgi:hypothetical protein
MATSVIHFGEDICFRLPVLESAGYSVAECHSIELLSAALRHNPEAVLLEEEPQSLIEAAAFLTRSRSAASLILFHSEVDSFTAGDFDLVIPSLTPPEEWLSEIADLLQQSRTIRAESQTLLKASSSLRQDSAAVRKAVSEERARSIRERARSIGHGWGNHAQTDPPSD